MRVTKLTVGKGRTSRPSEQEEWRKDYFEVEITIEDPAELEVAKANAEGLLSGWFSQISANAGHEVPDLDMHELEHDAAWRSWQKDNRGQCSLSVEEGKAGWIRIKTAGNTVLVLVKAMKAKNLDKISLGIFEYNLKGDFLQRRPLKEPEPEDTHPQS